MKKTFQIIILLILTFTIGFVVGFLVNGRMVSHRIDKMRSYYNETGFGREIMHIIKPTDQQHDEIIPILKEYAHESRELMGEYRHEQAETFNDLINELDDILNEEQLSRLQDHWKKKRARFDDRRPGQRKSRGKHQNGKGRPGSP